MPLQVMAGFLSSILGSKVSANTDALNSNQENKNSQNMTLLQANVSSISIFQSQKAKTKDSKDNDIDINSNVNIVNNNALSSTGVSNGRDDIDSSCGEIIVYTVTENDSISKIALLLNVSENTVLAANNMKKKLVKDDVLVIPDVSGVKINVTKGQTLQSIAKRYKVNINDIAFCNGIAPDTKLAINDELMIPGGEMFDEGGDKPAPNLSSSIAKDINYYITHPIRELINYFIYPLPPGVGRKTQGLHGPGKRGIDYGAPKGTPIYASAKGVVSVTCGGWCGAYGKMVIVNHPDKDTKTLYAHMSKITVRTGDEVAQGQIIGNVGSSGRSTGPHLHFEVFYFKHPGVDGSWAN